MMKYLHAWGPPQLRVITKDNCTISYNHCHTFTMAMVTQASSKIYQRKPKPSPKHTLALLTQLVVSLRWMIHSLGPLPSLVFKNVSQQNSHVTHFVILWHVLTTRIRHLASLEVNQPTMSKLTIFPSNMSFLIFVLSFKGSELHRRAVICVNYAWDLCCSYSCRCMGFFLTNVFMVRLLLIVGFVGINHECFYILYSNYYIV